MTDLLTDFGHDRAQTRILQRHSTMRIEKILQHLDCVYQFGVRGLERYFAGRITVEEFWLQILPTPS